MRPSPAVIRRERAHRRVLAGGLALLLLLAIGPLLVQFVPFGVERYPGEREHVWALCLAALRVLLSPVYGLFHVLFIAGLVCAVADRCRAWRRARSVVAALRAMPPAPGDAVSESAVAAGINPARVLIVEGLPTPAFTTGWLAPRIYVARELAAALSHAELTCVLAHEGAHLARRDPMRLSLLRFLSCTLFWVPALRALAADIADEAEIQADDAAAGQPLVLASAIVKLARWQPPSSAASLSVGFNERDLLARRVRRLAGDDVGIGSRVAPRSLAGAALLLALLAGAGSVGAHPFTGGVPHTHCRQHEGAAIFHLFCPGVTAAGDHCPHRHPPPQRAGEGEPPQPGRDATGHRHT